MLLNGKVVHIAPFMLGYALILLGRSDVNLKCDLQHQDLPVGAKERCFSVGN